MTYRQQLLGISFEYLKNLTPTQCSWINLINITSEAPASSVMTGICANSLGNEVFCFNPVQFKALNPAIMASLTMRFLNVNYFQDIAPSALQTLSTNYLARIIAHSLLSPQQIQGLNPELVRQMYLSGVDPNFLQHMTLDQFSHLSMDALARLTTAQVGRLSIQMLRRLSSEQLAAIREIAAVSPSLINGLSESQIQGLSTHALTNDQIRLALPRFSQAQIDSINSSRLFPHSLNLQIYRSLPSQQRGAIARRFGSLFPSTLLNGLAASQIEEIPATQIREFSVDQIRELSPSVIQALTPAQFRVLNHSVLTRAQLKVVRTEQVQALSSDQRRVLPIEVQLGNLSVSRASVSLVVSAFGRRELDYSDYHLIRQLTADQLMALFRDYAREGLTPYSGLRDLVRGLTEVQFGTIGRPLFDLPRPVLEIIVNEGPGLLSREQIPLLSEAMIREWGPRIFQFDGTQLSALSQNQVQAIASGAFSDCSVARFPNSFIHYLSESQVRALSTTQRRGLTQSQRDAFPAFTRAENFFGERFINLTPASIPDLGVRFIQEQLGGDRIQFLSDPQISAFSNAQFHELTPQQWNQISGRSSFETLYRAYFTYSDSSS